MRIYEPCRTDGLEWFFQGKRDLLYLIEQMNHVSFGLHKIKKLKKKHFEMVNEFIEIFYKKAKEASELRYADEDLIDAAEEENKKIKEWIEQLEYAGTALTAITKGKYDLSKIVEDYRTLTHAN